MFSAVQRTQNSSGGVGLFNLSMMSSHLINPNLNLSTYTHSLSCVFKTQHKHIGHCIKLMHSYQNDCNNVFDFAVTSHHLLTDVMDMQ